MTLVPLAVLTFMAITLSSSAVSDEVRTKVRASATLEARVTAVRMGQMKELVVFFAGGPRLVTALGDRTPAAPRDLPALQQLMDQFVSVDPALGFASVYDPSGRLIAVSPPSPWAVGNDHSYRDWYRGIARTGQPYVSSAYRTAVADSPLVVGVTAPIRASGGTTSPEPIIGYILVGYRLDAIQRFVRDFNRGQGVALTVTDQGGAILAAPSQPSGLVSAAADPRVRPALAGQEGTTSVDQPAGPLLSGYAPVAGLGWAVHADVPEAEAFASVSSLRKAVLVIAALMSAGLVVASLLLARAWLARARAEALATQAAQYARRLIEASLDPLVTISTEGRITDVNEATIRATGVPREGMVGSDFSDYFTQLDEALQGSRQVFARGFVTDYPLTIRNAGGALTDVLYNASVYNDAAGNVLGVFAAARDVTARKRAEVELAQRAQELQQANIDLGRSNSELEQFAYVASHDLSEPLRAISGPISLLARRYRGQFDDEADQFIGFAVDGCQRMQRMIDDLLVYSRVGRLERSFASTDCNLVVSTVLGCLRPTIEETGAAVRVAELPTVMAESIQVAQVFQNLIANAVKFVAEGETPEVSVAANRTGGEWRFTVTDNGIGIAPRYRDRVFVMFKRLHGREDYPGTGIGLALAKKIVERHGGRIGVDDNPAGPGSRFWFTLPAEEIP